MSSFLLEWKTLCILEFANSVRQAVCLSVGLCVPGKKINFPLNTSLKVSFFVLKTSAGVEETYWSTYCSNLTLNKEVDDRQIVCLSVRLFVHPPWNSSVCVSNLKFIGHTNMSMSDFHQRPTLNMWVWLHFSGTYFFTFLTHSLTDFWQRAYSKGPRSTYFGSWNGFFSVF